MLVKYNTVQEKLGLFNSIYDLQNEEDVGYLTRVFAVLKDKNLLTYYESIWIKKYDKIDLTIAYTLFSNGLYDKAFAKFIEAYENGLVGDQLKSIVLAAYILHGYDYPSVYNIHGFPDEDRRFLKLIFSNKPVKIPGGV